MDKVIEFLHGFNFQTILSLFVIVWYFSRDIKSSIDSLDKDIREMNTRVGRIEGTVYGTNLYKENEK